MNILINYADGKYYQSQKQNSFTGLNIAGFDKVIEYNKSMLDKDFLDKNKFIFNYVSSGYWGSGVRGAGYWIWKPYIIYNTLLKMKDDDILFYCDSGAYFIDDMRSYFNICQSDKKGIILFHGNHINKIYTKRDCFVYMDCDEDKYINGNQLTASFQLCRKTNFTINFYKEVLDFCQNINIITDINNICGLDNYNDFIDHRHDQSVLSLLCIKYNCTTLIDPSQWGNEFRNSESLRQVIYHHRNQS